MARGWWKKKKKGEGENIQRGIEEEEGGKWKRKVFWEL